MVAAPALAGRRAEIFLTLLGKCASLVCWGWRKRADGGGRVKESRDGSSTYEVDGILERAGQEHRSPAAPQRAPTGSTCVRGPSGGPYIVRAKAKKYLRMSKLLNFVVDQS